MSISLSLAKQAYSAFNREKPHSSITDLIQILTSTSYDDESFDGIPELVDVINLQPTGPAEASRAIRKKIKHGNPHEQYRALVLLKATVENGGEKFQKTFADGQLTDAIKHLASDSGTDPKVKRKLVSMLLSWRRQFEGDPSMTLVANLYKSVPQTRSATAKPTNWMEQQENEYDVRKREEREAKEEAKRKAKQAKIDEKQRREEEERRKKSKGKKREPFDFEKEKPNILNSIAETSQAANNLMNALTLVNTETEKVQDNPRVQECLEKAKLTRKRLVRYVQQVENEEFVGTLLDTNERVISSLQMYDALVRPELSSQEMENIQSQIASVKINNTGEVDKLQEKQRAAVERSISRATRGQDLMIDAYDSPPHSATVYSDLQDINFGEIDEGHRHLPPPLQPSAAESDEEDFDRRGSLSDFSDYSSDEQTHNRRASTSYKAGSTSYGTTATGRHHVSVSEDNIGEHGAQANLLDDSEDPFADPFADHNTVAVR